MVKLNRKFLVLAAAVAALPAFAACAANPPIRGTAAGVVSPASNSLMLPSLMPSEVELLQRMTDPNILGHIAMGDSVELVMASLAVQRSRSADVLDLARRIIDDHSNSLSRGRDIARKTGLGMHTIAGELALSHMGPWVDSVGPRISDVRIDHNFLIAQIEMHQHMLAEMNTLLTVARDSSVRWHIETDIPTLTDHLERARALAVKRQYIKANEQVP